MARKIEFDRDNVINNSMLLFWEKGYKATSMRDLIETTGLKPGSLYGSFKNKRQLYLIAIDRYFDKLRQEFQSILNNKSPPLLRIKHFYKHIAKESLADKSGKGCLLVNAILEVPSNDTEITNRITQMFKEIENEFKQLLIEAQKQGDLSKDKDPTSLAKLLITTTQGLRVINKTNPSKAELNSIIKSLLYVIE